MRRHPPDGDQWLWPVVISDQLCPRGCDRRESRGGGVRDTVQPLLGRLIVKMEFERALAEPLPGDQPPSGASSPGYPSEVEELWGRARGQNQRTQAPVLEALVSLGEAGREGA